VMTFDQVGQNEARRVFTAVVSNDPRPHYFHQSNLIAGDDEDASGLVYTLLDAVLDRCRSHLADDVQVQQPTLAEIGRLLLRLHAWQIVLAFGSVRAYLEGDRVTLINDSPSALEVPLTGALAVGESDSDCDWVRVEPGETSLERRPYSPELT
jgi:hypothetical protein